MLADYLEITSSESIRFNTCCGAARVHENASGVEHDTEEMQSYNVSYEVFICDLVSDVMTLP